VGPPRFYDFHTWQYEGLEVQAASGERDQEYGEEHGVRSGSAASAAIRLGGFHAGLASAADPRYTVVPQRQRRDGRAVAGAG
jgi:formate dehydrogenase major subunit